MTFNLFQAMKKAFIRIVEVVSLMALIGSCAKEISTNEQPIENQKEDTFVMNIIAGNPETKTVVSESGDNYVINWENGNQIAVYEVANGEVQGKTSSAALSLTEPAATATFTLPFTGTPSAPYDYTFIYPASALDKSGAKYRVRLNKNQTFKANSFDPDADILISEHVHEATERPSSRTLKFARIGATGRMVIKAPTTDETVQKITLSTTQGNLSGYYELTPADGTLSAIYSGDKEIVLTPESTTSWSSNIVVWFRCAEITLSKDFTVTVKTNLKTYTKVVDLESASRTLQFAEGKLTKFNVNMTTTTGEANPTVDNGWYVLAAEKDGSYYALSNTANGDRLAKVNLPATFNPSAGFDTDDETIVWKVTNGDGNVTIQAVNNSYLNSRASGALTSNTSQSFTLNEAVTGKYEINSVSHGGIRYNASSSWWGFYTSGKGASMIGDIYFVEANIDKTPVLVINNISLPVNTSASNVEIQPAASKFVSSITVNGVFNEAERTSDCTWASVAYSGGVLKYTVETNDLPDQRIAYVRVTGSNGDGGSQVVDFTITQAGKPSYSNQWALLTEIAQLAVNDKVVIVNTGGTKALGTTQNSNNRNAVDVTLDVTNPHVVNITSEVQQLTVGKSNGNWTFYTGSGYLYAASSSSNYLRTQADNDANGEWTIDLNSSFEAEIVAQGTNTHNRLKNNGTMFACYTTDQTAVKIYKWYPDSTPRTINITSPSNGTVVTDPANTTTTGTLVTITATPNSGFGVYDVAVVDGSSNTVAINQLDATHYTFSMPASDATITVTFKKQSVVTLTYGTDPAHGSISISPASPVFQGETVTVTATPDSGYALSALKYNDGSDHDVLSAMSFTMPGTAVTVTATFAAVPTINMLKTEINDVSAAGVSNANESEVYEFLNGATDANVTVTCDGGVVTSASKNNGGVTYTVASNTGGARSGWIKVKYGSEDPYTVTVNQLAGGETLQYTLDGTKTGGSNGYATESEITQDGVTWKATGNTTVSPWRIGGNGIKSTNRAIYSTTSISSNITRVDVTSGEDSGSITINSLTISVHESASDAATGSNPIETITENSSSNIVSNTVTLSKAGSTSWEGKYYRIVYNVTVSGSSNKYIKFVSAEFYGN